jgi:Leucine-rich repeat (LRR) protein
MDKFRVTCHNGSNLNTILSSLDPEDTIDKLEIHNCEPKIMKLQILPPMKVKSLTIDGCGIEEIDENAWNNVALELDELKLTNNLLKKIPSLIQLTNLISADFSHNQINYVLINGFMYRLKTLLLDHNSIQRLEPMTFAYVPVIEKISLQENKLSYIAPTTFNALDHLRVLMLANNSLTVFEKGALDGMKNLQQLNLRNNSLPVITNDTLYTLPKLYAVDFSYNDISQIESGAFDKLVNLYWLDLSHNNISTLEDGTFKRKIANIIIDEQNLMYDKKLNWFVAYLVKNQVHTFFSPIPEPEKAEDDIALKEEEVNSKSSRNLRIYTIIGLTSFGILLLLILVIHSCCSKTRKVNLVTPVQDEPLSLKNFRPGKTSTLRHTIRN